MVTDSHRMLALVEDVLSAATVEGYPLLRLVAHMEATDRWGYQPHKRTLCLSHRFTSTLSDYEVPSTNPSNTCDSRANKTGARPVSGAVCTVCI